MGSEICYKDRESGAWLTEQVFGEQELRLFYESRLGGLLERGLFSRAPFSHLYGRLKRSRRSKAQIPAFVQRLGIDASEAELPLSDYESLDAFFARRLHPGARPLDPDPTALLSPADGRALVFPSVAADGRLRVKRSEVSPLELLGSAALANRFHQGAVVIVRLAPADYHRFDFPAAGRAGPSRPLEGPLHSVHPIALGGGAPSFVNKRSVCVLESEAFGPLALVEVGAMVVGTIEQTYRPGPVSRGEEKGTFHFGGSTVVLLAERGRLRLDEDLVRNSAEGIETYVRMGTRIARQEAACSAS